MKTLLHAEDIAELVRRLRTIGPSSGRRWGTMTAAQMVCHLSDAFRVALGEKTANPLKNRYSGPLMRWAALWIPLRWPHGVPTVPECDANARGSPPSDFERDKNEVVELLERFALRCRESGLASHPLFGAMTEKQWMRWGYLHTDHHLRQFGA